MGIAPIGRMLSGWDNKFEIDHYCKFCKKFLDYKDIEIRPPQRIAMAKVIAKNVEEMA